MSNPTRRRALAVVLVVSTSAVLASCAQGAPRSADSVAEPRAVSAAPPAPAEAAAQRIVGTVWVANEDGNSLTAIDAATHEVLSTVTGIDSPHNVQVSPDGTAVWAVSGHNHAVVAIDSASLRVLSTAPTGAGPAHVVLAPDGTRAYVTNAGDDTLSSYDVAGLAAGETPEEKFLPLGEGPHGLRPSADGSLLVVANTHAGTVDLVKTADLTVEATIEVGDSPVQVALDPDGRYAYVSLAGDGAVAKVDLAARKVVATVEVSAAPVQLYLTPDGSRLASADQGTDDEPGDSVSVIDVDTMVVTDTIATGSGPHGVVIDPTGTLAWVTNLYDDTVSVLDLVTARTVATIDVGDKPNGISFSSGPAPRSSEAAIEVPDHSGDSHGDAGDEDGEHDSDSAPAQRRR